MAKLPFTNIHYAAFMFQRLRCGRIIMSASENRHLMKVTFFRDSRRFLATAAHKFEIQDQQSRPSNDAVLRSVDEAFTNIDYEVRRTGRAHTTFVEGVFRKIKALGTASSMHGLYLIRCCGRLHAEVPHRRKSLIDDVWKTLNDFNTSFCTDHYNALLKVYLQNGIDFSPMQFLSEMEHKNIQPDKVTYQLFVEKFSNDGDFSGASIIIEYMKEKDMAVNEEVFNSLIKCHTKTNDMDGAYNMLQVMKKSNLNPSSKTYMILACAYAEAGNIEGMKKALLQAQQFKIRFSNENYLELIASLAVGDQKSYIEEMIERLDKKEEHRHDFVTAIMNLINKGFHDVAYKFLLKFEPSHFTTTSNLFIKQLIKVGESPETILSYCKDFEQKGYDKYLYVHAAKVAAVCKMNGLVFNLFKEMQNQGIPVKSHYFTNILEIHRQNNELEGAWQVLKLMYELGVPANFNIYLHCAHTAANNNLSASDTIAKFEENGHSASYFAAPLFQCYCESYRLNDAKYLIKHYPTCSIGLNFPLLKFLSLYEKFKEDPESFFQILDYIMRNSESLSGEKINNGNFLVHLMNVSVSVFEDFMKWLNYEGVKLNEEDIHFVWSNLREIAPKLIPLLRKSLHVSHSNKIQDFEHQKKDELSIEKLEKHLADLYHHGLSTATTLYNLLLLHMKNQNQSRAIELFNELENQDFKFGANLLYQMMNLFAGTLDLDMMEKLFKKMKDTHPNFKFDGVKLISFATALIKHGKYDEAVNFMEKELKNAYSSTNPDLLTRSIKRLLDAASETGNVSLVKNLYELIMSSFKFLEQEIILMDALVKVHLIRQDLCNAIEEFRDCAVKHRVFPYRYMLLRKCIYSDDPKHLQRVVDVTSMYGGEKHAMFELLSILLENGRVSQAKNVLQSLGRRADSFSLEMICNTFLQQNKERELQQLILISQDLLHIDRDKMYYILFKLYAERNDYRAALKAYSLFKQENIRPSEKTIELLSDLLGKNKQPLPFNEFNERSVDSNLFNSNEMDATVISFVKHVDENQTSEALEILQNMKKGHVRSIPLQYMTNLIDALVLKKTVKDLALMVQPMSYIIDNDSDTIKPLLEKYSTAGDVDACYQLQNFLPDFLLKKASYNFYLSKAYIVSGRHGDLLSELEKRCDKKNKLFSIYAFQELLKDSSLVKSVTNLAQRYLNEFNIDLPISVIWAHHFANEDYSKAEDFYKLHPVSVMKVDSIIIKAIRNDQNIKLGRKYIDFLIQYDFKQTQKDKAYRSQLDALVSKEMYKDASSLVAECDRQKVPILKLNRTTLIALKSALERENIEVTFSITEDSDSSSDSD